MDLSLISQALASLNAASGIAKGLISLRDEARRLTDGNQLLSEINKALGDLNAFQIAATERTAQLEAISREKRDLEEELRRIKAEKDDFGRYELNEVAPGVFAYALREDQRATEPMHCICPACRSNGKKSILKRVEKPTEVLLECLDPNCKVHLQIAKKTVQPIPLAGANWW